MDLKSTPRRRLGLLCCGGRSMTVFVCWGCVRTPLGPGDVCQLPGSLPRASASQSVCSGQLLSAKNGSSAAGLPCRGNHSPLSINRGDWISRPSEYFQLQQPECWRMERTCLRHCTDLSSILGWSWVTRQVASRPWPPAIVSTPQLWG